MNKTQSNKVAPTTKKDRKKLKFNMILTIFSIVLVGIGLLWQWSTTLTAICNAFFFAFSIYLLLWWIVFIYNENILSSIIHSVKTFGLMIVGKRPKLKYSEYKLIIEENQIPNFYGRFLLLHGSLTFIITMVLLVYIELY